jgi:hypothetical protein
MCFLIAVGATRNDWQLASWVEDQLGEQAEVAMAPERFAVRFPAQDVVRTISCGGCSCSLLRELPVSQARNETTRVELTDDCRRALVGLARKLGTLRVFVGRIAGASRGELRPVRMTADELSTPHGEIPTEWLLEVAASTGHAGQSCSPPSARNT